MGGGSVRASFIEGAEPGPVPRPHSPECRVIWLTGLSGAGKSTLAREVAGRLRASGCASVVLDGDDVRLAIADTRVAHDRDSRLTNAMRICRLARMISLQGVTVVVATMSMFHEVHQWNRDHQPNFFQVLLRVPLDVLRQRDARGLYSRAEQGEVGDVVGIHVPYEEPGSPDLVLTNDGPATEIRRLADEILQGLLVRAGSARAAVRS
ncbi:MAG: adenylyl-sulfate kinase [Verrucomicrobia bacterium]|nr:adenylyl-sulfate kinase [Verrucomicrobiota bacterium]